MDLSLRKINFSISTFVCVRSFPAFCHAAQAFEYRNSYHDPCAHDSK